jgi:hypothetical protein
MRIAATIYFLLALALPAGAQSWKTCQDTLSFPCPAGPADTLTGRVVSPWQAPHFSAKHNWLVRNVGGAIVEVGRGYRDEFNFHDPTYSLLALMEQGAIAADMFTSSAAVAGGHAGESYPGRLFIGQFPRPLTYAGAGIALSSVELGSMHYLRYRRVKSHAWEWRQMWWQLGTWVIVTHAGFAAYNAQIGTGATAAGCFHVQPGHSQLEPSCGN